MLPRITSSNGSRCDSSAGSPSSLAKSCNAAARPISTIGVRIPQDVSITGVDNTDLGATQTPALTSVRTPVVEIGHAAGLQLIARLEGKPTEQQQVLPFVLEKRASIGPAPGTPVSHARGRRR